MPLKQKIFGRYLDDIHLGECEAAGRHGDSAVTGGAVVIRVTLVARVADHVHLICNNQPIDVK